MARRGPRGLLLTSDSRSLRPFSVMARIALPPYVVALLRDVRERSGRPIVLVDGEAEGYDSQLRFARGNMEAHEVAVVSEYRPYALHFLVSGSRKVLRFFEAMPDSQLLPSYEAGRCLPVEEEEELRRNFQGQLDDRGVRAVSQFLFAGAIQQLTSVPIDLRVERELYEELPEHRSRQRAYLQRQVSDLEPHFTPEIAGPAPRRSYAATSAMNVALAEEAAEISGVTVGPLVRVSPHRPMGTRLRQILRSEQESGYRGDLRVTDAWAEQLGMRDWYGWSPLQHPR